jgi:hypothetical protein
MQHCCCCSSNVFHNVSASAASRITYQEYVLRIVRINVLVLPVTVSVPRLNGQL